MSPTYKQLKALGNRFLGPVFAPAIVWLGQRIEEVEAPEVLFAGREGYFLQKLVTECQQWLQSGKPKPSHYLTVSRAFLFRLTLARPEFLPFALQHSFTGSLEDILKSRFSLSHQDIQQLGFVSEKEHSFSLPDDAKIVEELIRSKIGSGFLKHELDIYTDYFCTLSPGKAGFHVVDIGYAGTIQKLLTGLMNRPSTGSYLMRTADFEKTAVPLASRVSGTGYWSNSAKFGGGDPLVDFSLVMEAIFTAPVGQLRRVSSDDRGKLVFHYGPEVSAQHQFHVLTALVEGISDYLFEYVKAHKAGLVPDKLVDGRAAYIASIQFDRSADAQFLRETLHIDDNISGHGVIAPYQALGI